MNAKRDKNRAEAVVAALLRLYDSEVDSRFDWEGAASLLELDRIVTLRHTHAGTYRVVKGARRQSFPLDSVRRLGLCLYIPDPCLRVRDIAVAAEILGAAIAAAAEVRLLKQFWPTAGKRFLLRYGNRFPDFLPNSSGGYTHVARSLSGGPDRFDLYPSIVVGVV